MNNRKQKKPEVPEGEAPLEKPSDVAPEEARPEAEESGSPATDEDPLTSAKRQRDEFRDLYQRSLAEQENARKRQLREMAEQRQYSVGEFARDLLDVVDNLQRALAGLPSEECEDPLAAGVRLVEEQLLKTLENHGVKAIEAIGQPFDPMLHQAVMEDETDQAEPGTITAELARGYCLGDRLLRAAVVKVAKLPALAKESPADEPIED